MSRTRARRSFVTRPSSLVTVIVPTLNEAAHVERTLANVRAQTGPMEVVVVDGRSTDDTRALATGHARVIEAPRGRARQMNAGAEIARGDVLLFLHADTLLPPDGLAAVRRVLNDPAAEAGIFRLAFDRNAPLLRFYSLCTALPWSRLCFGDRALFVRRNVFDAVGGFPEWPLFEDLEMARRLHRRGGFRYLPQRVVTSARRFERFGHVRQQLHNAYLWSRYLLGAPVGRLARHYGYAGHEATELSSCHSERS